MASLVVGLRVEWRVETRPLSAYDGRCRCLARSKRPSATLTTALEVHPSIRLLPVFARHHSHARLDILRLLNDTRLDIDSTRQDIVPSETFDILHRHLTFGHQPPFTDIFFPLPDSFFSLFLLSLPRSRSPLLLLFSFGSPFFLSALCSRFPALSSRLALAPSPSRLVSIHLLSFHLAHTQPSSFLHTTPDAHHTIRTNS